MLFNFVERNCVQTERIILTYNIMNISIQDASLYRWKLDRLIINTHGATLHAVLTTAIVFQVDVTCNKTVLVVCDIDQYHLEPKFYSLIACN